MSSELHLPLLRNLPEPEYSEPADSDPATLSCQEAGHHIQQAEESNNYPRKDSRKDSKKDSKNDLKKRKNLRDRKRI